jgi:predicted phosphodiesterase
MGEPQVEMAQFRGRNASLWQSAVDQVVAKRNAVSPAASFGIAPRAVHLQRPRQDDSTIQSSNDLAALLNVGPPGALAAAVPEVAPPSAVAAGLVDTTKFCSATALRLAEAAIKAHFSGDYTEVSELHAQLDTPFAQCDPKWGEVLATYVASRVAAGPIPYRRYSSLSDFVITDRLPDNATVVLIADWGTGQPAAKALLAQVASQKPDVVIHLGDVYYSGSQSEVQNYFYSIWQASLGIPNVAWGDKLADLAAKPATFHMPGNHDMYAGGAPYYAVIDMLGQPASYFCLRNSNWQFVTMDTSLHDSDPATVDDATDVDGLELIWMKDKVNNAGGRKTILLTHHQLFTRFEKIGGQALNQNLLPKFQDVLPKLAAWIWGHEHNMVIYQKYQGVLGRCIGHGAFPVSNRSTYTDNFPDVPLEDVHLDADANDFYRHGYVLMKMNGPSANLQYIQFNADTGTENVLFEENL